MRFIYILLVIAVLFSPISLAQGLAINELRVNVEYDEAYTFRLDHPAKRKDFQLNPADGSVLDVEVLPGSKITFTVFVENTLEIKQELRDILVTATIEEVNEESDIEVESGELALDPGEDERVDIILQLPFNIDEGRYRVTVEAIGKDKFNGIVYFEERTFQMDVKKRTSDIKISKAVLEPKKVSCGQSAKIVAEATNIGSKAQSNVALEFKSSPLGINSADRGLFLESSEDVPLEDRMHFKSYQIDIPEFFRDGKYPVLVNLYWNGFVLFDREELQLVVQGCSTQDTKEEIQEEEEEIKVPEKNETAVSETAVEEPKQEALFITQESLFSNQIFLIVLAIGGVGALIVIILIAIAVFKGKGNKKL